MVSTQDPVSALQLERLFAAAQVVDEVSQLVDALQTLGHDHLLMDQVGLRQVGAGLMGGGRGGEWRGEGSVISTDTF